MKRRDALKSMGALAGAATMSRLLPGCGDDGPGTIDTYVFLMMENRSYDHQLGARSMVEGLPGDGPTAGATNPDTGGTPIALFEAPDDALCVPDPAHGWDASHVQFHGGLNDGFVTTQQAEHPGDVGPMQYLTRRHLPVTYALADAYATCDRWFASVMGPTWPNRFYWLSGTSMGLQSNDLPDSGYTAPTIFGRMDDAGVDWKLYYGDLPFVALFGAQSDVDLTDRGYRMEDFFEDAAAGTLPSVVYLDPPFSNADDHPPHHPILAQQFLASVYRALATSPQWKRCLLVVTYDEHGGFYDHVAPPTAPDDNADAGFDQLGFRVPALVIGPYVKQGHVSSVQRDHTSALKHLENVFGTAPLTARSSAANDLSELIDDERLARGEPAAPIELPEIDVDDWLIDSSCAQATFRRQDHDVLRVGHDRPDLTAAWDRRADLRSLTYAIRDRAKR